MKQLHLYSCRWDRNGSLLTLEKGVFIIIILFYLFIFFSSRHDTNALPSQNCIQALSCLVLSSLGLVWLGLSSLGLVWLGLSWLILAGLGLAWLSLISSYLVLPYVALSDLIFSWLRS